MTEEEVRRKVEYAYAHEFNHTLHCYIDITGDLIAGTLLSQILYWFSPNKSGQSRLRVVKDGRRWLAKSRNEWYSEIRISAKQYDRAIKILQDKNFVEVKIFKFNGVPTTHITVNDRVFNCAVNEWKNKKAKQIALLNPENYISPNGNMEFDQLVISEFTDCENQYIPNGNLTIPEKGNSITEYSSKSSSESSTKLSGKNKNQPGEIHIEIINYLNQKTGKRFRADTVETVKLISHLINRGYTVDDFRKVIDFKCVEWIGNSYMEPKLRPSTLFAESNFESYVQQDAPIPQKGATYGRQNNTFVDNSSTGGVQAPSY